MRRARSAGPRASPPSWSSPATEADPSGQHVHGGLARVLVLVEPAAGSQRDHRLAQHVLVAAVDGRGRCARWTPLRDRQLFAGKGGQRRLLHGVTVPHRPPAPPSGGPAGSTSTGPEEPDDRLDAAAPLDPPTATRWSPGSGCRSPRWFCCSAWRSWASSAIARTPPTRRSPRRSATSDGRVVYTGDDVRAGQKLFLRKGLMEYGSIFGHGAYLGPDFTADYLHRAARSRPASTAARPPDTARDKVVADFKTNRYDADDRHASPTPTPRRRRSTRWSRTTRRTSVRESASKGLLPEAITDPAEIKQLTAYFAWSAWAGSTLRPDKDYTYTNNWPPEDAGRQHGDRQRRGLERAVADRPARRHRRAVRRVRPLG